MLQSSYQFRGTALSGFCMQVSLLYQAAVPLCEGLSVMAQDSCSDKERECLLFMADKLRMGYSFRDTIRETGSFPAYTVDMVSLGEQTGTLDVALDGLAMHYEKETRLNENLRRALSYPTMMISMLLVILFVLFVKIMPVFTDVYEQLGAGIPSVTQTAIRLGGYFSGFALIVIGLFSLAILFFRTLGARTKRPACIESILSSIRKNSEISRMTALGNFCRSLSVSLRCGLCIDDGFLLAEKLAAHPEIQAQIQDVHKRIQSGMTFYESVKETNLFEGFQLQLIRVANRTGNLDQILEKLAGDYDERISEALNSGIAKVEPAIVAILAFAVGLVLFSVMLPLVGILSAIG